MSRANTCGIYYDINLDILDIYVVGQAQNGFNLFIIHPYFAPIVINEKFDFLYIVLSTTVKKNQFI